MPVISRMSPVVAFVSLLLLAGCAAAPAPEPGTTASAPRPTASATATKTPPALPSGSPSETPSSTPAPTAAPLESLIFTPQGLGTLVVGYPVPDQGSPDSLVTWDPDYCEGSPTPDGNWAGAFLPVYPTVPSPSLGEREAFVVVTAEGNATSPLSAVRVLAPGVLTAAKIGVGSSRSDLLAAYPSFDGTTTGQVSDTYSLHTDGGRLVFEVANDVSATLGEYWATDVTDTVLWMTAIPADIEPYAIAGGDSGGPCVV